MIAFTHSPAAGQLRRHAARAPAHLGHLRRRLAPPPRAGPASRPPQGSSAAPFSPPQAPSGTHEQRRQLQKDLTACVKAEDYERAAVLRRQLDELERSDPLLSLQRALKEAVAQEQYQEAARLQRQLTELEQQLAASPEAAEAPPVDMASVPTSSDTTTAGVRVRVQSWYAPANSRPGLWMFAYKISITNNTSRVVQLKSRHWVITDEEGHKEEVRGPGVVGAQPVLLPGKTFEYMSGCPLRSHQGTMEGSYLFVALDEEDGTFKDEFRVRIGRFRLSSEGEAIM